ncbi:hypothetical protein [Polaromonas sp. UC242_47]|uniref:hypothetical protein n=1 Tax=Polaromonas sp. UC242_47 TaxID=3374626 RepID=UPI0037B89A5C
MLQVKKEKGPASSFLCHCELCVVRQGNGFLSEKNDRDAPSMGCIRPQPAIHEFPTKLPLTPVFGLTPRGAKATMLRGFSLFLIEQII